MRFATRHLEGLVALLALTAIPISIAGLRSQRWDDCAHPDALLAIEQRLPGTPGAPFQRFFRNHVFLRNEGTLPAPAGLHPLRYRVVRTDEARYPFDRQTRFLKVPMDPDGFAKRWIDAGADRVPIHLAYAQVGDQRQRLVASLFVYDGRAVDSLLRLQVASAPRQLLRGRRPITLFQVDGVGPSPLAQELEEGAVAWLRAAWLAYREACAL